MKLEDFETQGDSTFEDFNVEDAAVIPNTALNSNKNRAVMSIAISKNPEQAAQDYVEANVELETTGTSQTLENINAEAQQEVYEFSEESLVEGLLEPQLPDEVKLQMAQNHKDLEQAPVTTQELFVEKNIVEDGGEQTEEQVEVRSQLADIVKPYFAYKKEVQTLFDSNLATLDSSTLNALVDMIEVYLVPTAYNTHTKQILGGMLKAVKGEDTSGFTDFLLAGESNIEIKRMLDSVPLDQRLELTKVLIDVVNNESGIYLKDDNDYAKYESLRQLILGDYGEFDRWVDNAVGILDLLPVVGTLAIGGKAMLRHTDTAAKAVIGVSSPVRAGKVALETNPIRGFTMVDEAIKNDEVAETLFGTTSKDVAVEVLGPKTTTISKTVDPLPRHPDNKPMGDAGVVETLNKDGQIHYTEAEKASASVNIETAFQEATGINYRSELSQVGHEDGLEIRAVYTAGDSGWSSATEAREQVKFSLKDYGILDEEITVLKRDETGYNPVTDVLTDSGDYIVQVNYKTKINPNDVSAWSELDVKRNIFDRVSVLTGKGDSGSLQRHILDAHSTLNPTLTMGANVVVDKGALISRRITDLGEVFGNALKKMDDADKLQVDSYIKKANREGFEHTEAELFSQGFNAGQIEALTAWRKTWDTIYALENADLVRTLRSQGYKSLKTNTDNLLVRKTQMNFSNSRVYNPSTKKVETLSPDEMRKLYDEGGYVGESKSKLPLDGEHISHVLVKNDSTSYAKGLRESEAVLNYRKGYYQVNYDAPVFIDKIVRDAKGNELYRQAVGMARDFVEAKAMRTRWARAEGVADEVYGTVRENKQQQHISSDDYFDMQMSMGRSSQRVRGDRLREPTQPFTGGLDNSLVQDPIDALTHSARSIANRVSMRDWLESSKARFVDQFGDFLITKNGQKKFPRSIGEISKEGDTTSKGIADARTTWEYINYMEGGYINALDDGIKGTLRAIGNIMGNSGYGKSQRAMEWMASGKGITGMAKGTAFQLYIALNPLRQILVQSHQMVRLAAMNPKYALGNMTADLAMVQGARLTGKTNDLHKFVMDSGQIDAISRSNLLTDSLTEITHQSSRGALGKTRATAVAAGKGLQKAGFEFGESNNIITSLLSFRDQAIKAGKDINKADVRDEIYAQARNFTYNMTKAGDMPYNQNFMGIVMQFLQVPHKAITQTLFNRALTRKQRASALMFDTVMFGVPAYWAAEMWFGDILPDDPEVREVMEIGIESMMFNTMINQVADEHSELDFTSLAPTSAHGFADLFTRVIGEGLGGLVSKSPSGQLVFGTSPRISNFMADLGKFVGVREDYGSAVELSDAARAFVGLSSGMSNRFKMAYALEYGKMINSTGSVIDEKVTSAEAIGQLFGLPTMDVHDYYKTTNKLYTKSKEFRDDITMHYKEIKRQLALAGDDIEASKKVIDVMSMAWSVFKEDDIEARKMLNSLVQRDLIDGDDFLIKKFFSISGMMTPADFRIMVQDSPIEEGKKKELLHIADQLEQFKVEEK